MVDLLVVTSRVDRLGERPLAALRDQLAALRSLGVEGELLIDPPTIDFEMKIRMGGIGMVYLTPLCRPGDPDVDTRLLNHHMLLTRLLQHLGQPFIGQDFSSQLAINDKMLCAHVAQCYPQGWLFTRNGNTTGANAMLVGQIPDHGFPVIAKPNTLWASMGIGIDSVATSPATLAVIIDRCFERYPNLREIRVEKYLSDAREATVAIVGNGHQIVVGVTELLSDGGGHLINDEQEKTAASGTKRLRYRPWPPDGHRPALETIGRELFEKFRFNDVARFDVLVVDRPYVIDVNDMPFLGNAFCCDWEGRYGLRTRDLLSMVLAAASRRCRLELPSTFWASMPPDFRFDG